MALLANIEIVPFLLEELLVHLVEEQVLEDVQLKGHADQIRVHYFIFKLWLYISLLEELFYNFFMCSFFGIYF